MSYVSSNASVQSSDSSGFIRMTVDDLSYTPSAEEVTRHADQRIATGRRSWRMLKGKAEAVWPPNLEAALLEALERYQPLQRSGPYGTPGRFPMRNQFISDYIHETTGKRRTPKQVGSRLQQLRDTSKKAKLVDLISRRKGPDSGSELTPTRSTTPEARPRATASHQCQSDLVNMMACESPFSAYHDKTKSYLYGTDLAHHSYLPPSGTIHPPELLTEEMSAVRAAYSPSVSEENEPAHLHLHAPRYDYLREDRISNPAPWQMMPVFPSPVFPYYLSS